MPTDADCGILAVCRRLGTGAPASLGTTGTLLMKTARTHIASALGMGALWGFLLSPRLFPVSLAGDAVGPTAGLALYLLFGAALMAAGGALAYLASRGLSGAARRALAAGTGALGAAAVPVLAASPVLAPGSAALPCACLCVLAAFVADHAFEWLARARGASPRGAARDIGASAVVYCACSALSSLVDAPAALVAALSPLASAACLLLAGGGRADAGPSAPDGAAGRGAGPAVPGDATAGPGEEPGPGRAGFTAALLARLLVPCAIYLYLMRAMDILVDFITLEPLGSYRPLVFAVAALAVLLVLAAWLRWLGSPAKCAAVSFLLVSSLLLLALFFTSCQALGIMRLGNYALVVAKVLLGFYLWLLIARLPLAGGRAGHAAALSLAYLFAAVWFPNLVHNAFLALAVVQPSAPGLTGTSIALLAAALTVSVVSGAVLGSFVARDPASSDSRAPSPAVGAAGPGEASPSPSAGGVPPSAGSISPSDSGVPLSAAPLVGFQSAYSLSDREMDVVRLTCEGKTADRIAEELVLSKSTVYTHFKRIYQKTGVHSKQELIGLVQETGGR